MIFIPPRIRPGQSARVGVILLAVSIVGLAAGVGTAVGQQIQLPVQPGPTTSPDDDPYGVYVPTDRRLSRGVTRARERLQAGEYNEALAFLQQLLDRDEDVFVDDATDPKRLRGMKASARQLIAGLPAAGREMYGLLHTAAARRQLDAALASVDRALSARPDSAEAKGLRGRIQESRKDKLVAQHQSRALKLERDGSFVLAAEEYRKALALDPDLTTAQQGLARSEQGLRISRAFAGWIAQPDRLLDPRARSEASAMLVEAGAFPSLSDEMKQQAARVEELLAHFSQPVRVVFESDEQTEVTIQRISKLGSFKRREVELDPGTYVVLGIRRGYRDVRQTITVAPGQAVSPVVIRCTQPI